MTRSRTEVRRFIVDTDTGIDDALALLVLASFPDVEIVGVTTTHGNCQADQAARNARYVLDLAGLRDVPVAMGLPSPLVKALDVADYVHGADGVGNTGFATDERISIEQGVRQLARLAAAPNELELLALGPLTNLAAAEQAEPGTLRRFRSITIMGGMGPADAASIEAAAARTPNFLETGDPNTDHDPEACEIVTACADNVTWVGMNVTAGYRVEGSWLDDVAARGGRRARYVRDIHQFYIEFHRKSYGVPAFPFHDSTASLVAARRDMVLSSAVRGRVVVRRDERGASGAWLLDDLSADGAPHECATSIDHAAVQREIEHALLREPDEGGLV